MSKYLRAPRKKDEISSKDQPVTKIQDLDDLIAYMESLTPEITFRQNFLQFKTKNNELAFYLLEELEKYKLSGVVPLDQSPSQHLEHIMPRSLSRAKNRQGEWNKVRDLESYNDYKFRLGNLLILESEINQRASNRDFEFKKSCYVDSGLHYPIKITEIEDWNFEKIEERQKDMAEDALLIWNYEN
ncbi:HNH endonuclease family protein [Bacillus sp. RAR_GA_16]|uniref:HNH endonuclease family protein n=1 Tax=Bacillus sp. RAR_GA_16 TaxID=2876774 RepID=UPI001CCB1172|nr:HNH endonuclease family protein [Bacillus sp. RAR_GA_16]MCA0172972.1 HNH endonuclease family protein [Bacillus sp. RAR_GA_16]